ncbi:unnamed protein product [Arabis nemorensis]|uniref:Uncharacterized protein n=1 Tax=Arabis nemorensis TaxID=586526 RepID=A0A565B9R4_9BRAS|nr:unnamed protein product [Arabis nemorensis]
MPAEEPRWTEVKERVPERKSEPVGSLVMIADKGVENLGQKADGPQWLKPNPYDNLGSKPIPDGEAFLETH